MSQNHLKDFYDTLKISASLCLYPGMSCKEKPIKAHSIQNSRVFDLLNSEGHVIGLKPKILDPHQPEIIFDKIGRNKASIFEGFCGKHDKELFNEIDNFEFDRTNQKQLFLLAYRSVAKELHACISKAIKIQTAYLNTKENNILSEHSRNALFATQCIVDACDLLEFKNQIDLALLNGDYQVLTHRIFELETSSTTLACSQLFSNDAVIYKSSVSRIIMNIFPKSEKLTYAIFSSTKDEKGIVDDYLHKCIHTSSELRKYEISKMVIRNSENFFLNPKHFETWSKIKQVKILKYLVDTLFQDLDRDDYEYNLF
ncbi:hypothetical protein [Algoriphagus aquimarinus]|uniref:hypothetical protein n=1 Tax=Algoriphagus aquimarinus TaxID=237018 RepID=UPI0030D9EF94|tara:strand:- start:44771 stop:45709 length:939 start_codon:yes stop_codon:yes gene_type:complete